jgi:bicarbonate transport system permease protein
MTIARKQPTYRSFNLDKKMRERLDNMLTPLLTIVILLVIWQLLVMVTRSSLPGPIKVVQDTWLLILYPFYDRGGTDKGLALQVFESDTCLGVKSRRKKIIFALYQNGSRVELWQYR